MDTSEAEVEAFSKALFNVQDIDVNDKDNPQQVSEYVNDIYNYMRVLEEELSLKSEVLKCPKQFPHIHKHFSHTF